MSKKIVFLIVIFSFLFQMKVFAFDETYNNHEGCTYSNIAALKEYASYVDISYDYDLLNKMTVTLSNIQPEVIVKDQFDNEWSYNDNSENPGIVSVSGFFDNQKLSIIFYAVSSDPCGGEKLLEKTLKLPRFNPYYGTEDCEAINPEEFSMCAKWYPTYVEKIDFIEAKNAYLKSLEKEDIVGEVIEEKSIADYILEYYQYVLIAIALISIITAIILKIKEKNNGVL